MKFKSIKGQFKVTTALQIAMLTLCILVSGAAMAQDAKLSSALSARQLMVGDRANLFIEIQHNYMQSKVQWAVLPDTFNNLEIVRKGKIDTTKQGDIYTYKQKIEITGFDSGSFKVPAFQFSVIPNKGSAYVLQSDSFELLVNTVAVDTTKGYHGIKEIIAVKYTWMDYIWYIVGAAVLLGLIVFVIIYFVRNKKVAMPVVKPTGPVESLTDRYLRLLQELDKKQLWQNGQVKEYYVQLTDLLRNYIEERFRTQAMELTTDELLDAARKHKELNRHIPMLGQILRTADLAKFAKAEPLAQEHMDAMELAGQFVKTTKPVITETTTTK